MHENRIELLQGMPVFGATTPATLAFILERADDFRVAAGSYFFKRDDVAESFFVLETGRVQIVREYEGREFTLNELGPGDCFGEMALIECRNRNASVRAVQDCTALQIPLTTLVDLYQHDADQYLLIHMNMARELSRRLREADRRLFQTMVAASNDEGDWWWSVV